ncbi:S41 family peptidase [Colwellia piezophila]|uniref:S41 family peptidase n=1 Tax=Colwellia piezophila TaxID=211668 RepID=UPI00035E2331|nr:S41 family peptidase [Colwellia piezophila]
MRKLLVRWITVYCLIFSFPVMSDDIIGEEKIALLASLEKNIKEKYVLIDNIAKIEHTLRKISTNSNFLKAESKKELASIMSAELRKHDKHFTVQWRDLTKEPEKQEINEGWFAKLKRKNSGFNKVEILDGNIGYIDFWGLDELNEVSRARAENTLALVSEVDALIFDLRNNGGGSAEMVQLISSYFFDSKTHLNSFYSRMTGTTSEFWTFDKINGVKKPNLPLYILTSKHTFSAAEEFAYNFKHLKRATIVGEQTKGGANPWQYFELGDGFRAAIPIAKAVNPITKSNWEAVGVKPHVDTVSHKALEVAYKMALIEIKKSADNKYQIKDIDAKLAELAELSRNKSRKSDS